MLSLFIDHVTDWSFQLEKGEENGYLHFQGFFRLKNRNRFQWIQNQISKFNFLQERRGSVAEAWDYGSKLHTRVTGPFQSGKCPVETKKCDTLYADALAAPTVLEGLKIIKESKPRDFCLYGDRISKNLTDHHRPAPLPFFAKFTLDKFNRLPLTFNKSTVVWGDSNTGKTSFVKAHFANPLFCSHIDNLKKFDVGIHDAIIFDDMSFSHYPIESVIHLVDRDEDRTIHIRYSTVTIPANVTKVFTHNSREIFFKPDANPTQIAAVLRRVDFVHVIGPLFGGMVLPSAPLTKVHTLGDFNRDLERNIQTHQDSDNDSQLPSTLISLITPSESPEISWNEEIQFDPLEPAYVPTSPIYDSQPCQNQEQEEFMNDNFLVISSDSGEEISSILSGDTRSSSDEITFTDSEESL